MLKRLAADPKTPRIDTAPIKSLLGELMPVMHASPVGRMRLVNALKHKFGENYKSFEEAKKVIDHFDGESEHIKNYLRIKGVYRG